MMKCVEVKNKIEEFVYEKSIRPDDEMIRHIATCPECQSWLKSCQSAEKIARYLSKIVPVITDPDKFTTDILLAVEELEPKRESPKIHYLGIAKKFMVAATAALFIVFAYEQYVFVGKLTSLEAKMSATSKINSEADFYNKVITYLPEKGLEMVKSELAEQGLESKKMNFKSLIMMAGYSVLSTEEIVKQAKSQSFPNQNVTNKIIINR